MNTISESLAIVTYQFVAIFMQFPVISGVFLSVLAGNAGVFVVKTAFQLIKLFIPLRNYRILNAYLAYIWAVGWVWERNRLSYNYAGKPPNPKIINVLRQMGAVHRRLTERPDPTITKLLTELGYMPTGLWVSVGAGTEIKTGYLPRVRGYKEFGVKINQRNKLIL